MHYCDTQLFKFGIQQKLGLNRDEPLVSSLNIIFESKLFIEGRVIDCLYKRNADL